MDLGRNGTYGEVIVVPVQFVALKPGNLSFVETAAAWMQYLTAYGALITLGQLSADDFVVITAAGSSVGLAAIQIANHVGAIPIATIRKPEDKKALEVCGARYVIATDVEPLGSRLKEIAAGKGIRVIFDAVGGHHVTDMADAMSPGGVLIAHGMLSSDPTPFPLNMAIAKSLTMRGYVFTEVMNDPECLENAKRFILDGLVTGHFKPLIDKTFAFEDVREAHRYFESNRRLGKIVLTIEG